MFFVKIGGNEELLNALIRVITNITSGADEDDLVIDPIKTADAVGEALKERGLLPQDLITILPFTFGGISQPCISLDSLFANQFSCRNFLSNYCDESDCCQDSEKIKTLFSSISHAVDRIQLLGVILLALYSNRSTSPIEERFLNDSSYYDSIALSAEQTLRRFNPQFMNEVSSLSVMFFSRVTSESVTDEIDQLGDVNTFLEVNEPPYSSRNLLPKKKQNK